jgi:hypothetical protein
MTFCIAFYESYLFMTIPYSFLSCTDGRLEHNLTYRTVTTAAATTMAMAKQDCYVNTVIFCEVPGDQSLRHHSSTASPTTTTTVFTENRCSLLDQCEVRCCLQQSREVGKSSGGKHSCCPSRTAHCRHCDLVVMTSPLARPVSQPRTNQVKTPSKAWREQAQQQRHFAGGQEVNYRPSSSSRVPERKWSIIASANSEQSAKCVLNKSYVRPSYYSGKQLVHYESNTFGEKLYS